MSNFAIEKEFMLDGKPFKFLSGAIHYFRVAPEDWYHSLYNLKALGFNTVETYVPWNMHETKEGEFNFQGILDLEKFITTAEELGLFVIVRPSPYICAEWEFGGLPAWLLTKDCRIRSSDEAFLQYVERYYDVLLPKLVPHQIDHGGSILMMQLENEYGSYGEDHDYLLKMKATMTKRGVSVPLFTSDGTWQATLKAGSLLEENVLATGNFGSKGAENFTELKAFHAEHGKEWPLMCMEFWDGWFNRWGEPIVQRDTEELVATLREVVQIGSVNLYMFHGGTNFGFMNGCSARKNRDLPQITSYDYGAPLDEQGNPTEKYYRIKEMIHTEFPQLIQTEPLIKETIACGGISLVNKVSLFSVVEELSQKIVTNYPLTMEESGQAYGYMLYRTEMERDALKENYRLIDVSDRAQIYLNQEHLATQYQEEIGEKIEAHPDRSINQLDILVENMGRVNYGHKLLSETQKKGIRTGVMSDLHFVMNWRQYRLEFDRSSIGNLDFSKPWFPKQPAFYRYQFDLQKTEDCFIDLSGFGKGIVFINGHHIGRFWEKGPVMTLYITKHFLHEGENEIIIFETEGKYSETIQLIEKPILLQLEK